MTGGIRGAGHDDVTGQQGRERGNRGDLLGDAVNQVRSGAACHRHVLAVEREGDLRVLPVQLGLNPRAERAGRVEALRPRPHRIQPLQVTQRHVVDAREAQHVVHGLLDRHVLGDTPHNHRHFGLEVHIIRIRRDDDRIVRPDHRRGRLREDHHVFRRVSNLGVPALVHELRVRLVVLGETVHLGGNHRREQPQPIGVERVPLPCGLDGRGSERVSVQFDQVVLAVGRVLLDEGIARLVVE